MKDLDLIQKEFLIKFKEEAYEKIIRLKKLFAILITNPGSEVTREVLRLTHSLKGGAALLGLKEIETIAHQLEDELEKELKEKPTLSQDKINYFQQFLGTLHHLIDNLKTSIIKSKEIKEKLPLEEITLKVDSSKIDYLINLVSELALERWKLITVERNLAQLFSKEGNSKLHQTLKLLQDAIQKKSFLLQELQWELVELRLIPLNTLLDELSVNFLDMLNQLNKEAYLKIEGGEIRIDKEIAEVLKDPLVHLLRNALDHGIEAPLERLQKNKPKEGTISINITQKGAKIIIEVKDDGKGFDVEKIAEKALRRKIITFKEKESLSNQELLNLAFTPGLSTNPIITKFSGRGIGLDVVKEKIEKLNGKVRISSTPDVGTTITMTLPITLVSTSLLLFTINNKIMAIPTRDIIHLIKVDKNKLLQAGKDLACQWQGKTVPVVELINLWGEQTEEEKRFWNIILTQIEDNIIGLKVDEFLEEGEFIVKGLSNIEGLPYFIGATFWRGELVFILNIHQLLKLAPKISIKKEREKEKKPKRKILLAEDSLISRTLEKDILESAGFNVITAEDGKEAWDILSREPLDMAIIDIQMPGLDGFQVIQRIRSTPHLAELPVIIVSGMEREEEKLKGIEVGADAYLIKSNFNQKELLEIIYSFLGEEK